MNSFQIIKSVRLTEKGTLQAELHNQYTVVADRRANKHQIRQAVEELFKVDVLRVNTQNIPGRVRRKHTSHEGRTPAWKKALITLKEGQAINLT